MSYGTNPIPPAPSAITVGASPFSYQNTGGDADIIVSGGIVTLIEYSRNGSTWFTAGVAAGMFSLSSGDYIRVTYTTAPMMTRVPR